VISEEKKGRHAGPLREISLLREEKKSEEKTRVTTIADQRMITGNRKIRGGPNGLADKSAIVSRKGNI